MSANPDYKDLFSIFNAEKVEYLIVGAHAVIFYAEPRYTKDVDIWINPTNENAQKIWRALEKFGAPLLNVEKTDFTVKEMIYQIGIEPNRIDILMDIAGVQFEEAMAQSIQSTYDGIPIRILGKNDLITAKKASGRPQDLLDVERLEK
jgi:hypothetical protein